MSGFHLLILAILCEVVATSALKLSEGFTKPLPSVFVVVGYCITFYLLSLALKTIPVGTAYALWSGMGTVGIVIVGVLVWREPLDFWRIVGVSLIVLGVIVLNVMGSPAHSA